MERGARTKTRQTRSKFETFLRGRENTRMVAMLDKKIGRRLMRDRRKKRVMEMI